MKIHTQLLGALSLVAGLLGYQADAHACQPPFPGLNSSIPADGATYPANGLIFFSGYYIGLAKVTVTVNGQPASFSDISTTFAGAPFELNARIMPEPKPGDAIVISGDFCESDVCTPETISFTAGPADTVAPPAPSKLSFSVHDFPDFKSSGGDCQSDTDLVLHTSIEGMPASMDQAPLLYHVEAFSDEALTAGVLSQVSFANEASVKWGYRTLLSSLGGAYPGDLCFRVTAFDGAGNKSAEPISICKACYVRTDPPGMSTNIPFEPEWTAADIYKGGPCDTGMGTGGAGGSGGAGGGGGSSPEPGVEGCACSVPQGHSSYGSLAALVLAISFIGRRRSVFR